jgi:hypothetical protein
MNLLITADLRLDLWARAERDPFAAIVPVLRDLDALIVAGGLADNPHRNLPPTLTRLAQRVVPARIWIIPRQSRRLWRRARRKGLGRITEAVGVNLVQKRALPSPPPAFCAARSGPILRGWATPRRPRHGPRWQCLILPGPIWPMVSSSLPKTLQRSTMIISTD